MCPKHVRKLEQNDTAGRVPVQTAIVVANLLDLNPHTNTIIEALNADQRLMLLAVADPAGVLRDLGYELSPQAKRELRHGLPRMSREQRDRYLVWLRNLKDIPNKFNIKLVNRPSGKDLLRGAGKLQEKYETVAAPAGQGAGGFDVVAQFGETFCDRMLKRNYAFGHLPRSVYRINNNLKYYFSTGEYDDLASSIGTADREIHFGQPLLKFMIGKAEVARVTSPFIALGFTSQEIKGTVSVDARLSVKKDSKGQPEYVEITFDNLAAADVTVKLTTGSPSTVVSSELNKLVLDTYKSFRKLASSTPGIPLTFTLVDSAALTGKGTTIQVKTTAGIRKPSGAAEPLLMVGAERTGNSSNGDLDAIPCAIKSGGDFAVLQDSAWLEKDLNDGFKASLPVHFDQDSGQVDSNGDLRVDAISWSYRDGGLTSHVDATLEDAIFGTDVSLNDFEVSVDITFHSSDPGVSIRGTSGSPEIDCIGNVLFVLSIVAIGAVLGWGIGAAIGGVAGAAALGGLIGGVIGLAGGLLTGLAGIGLFPLEFDTSGVPYDSDGVRSAYKQELKITHTRTLPETGGSVTVVPNDYSVGTDGTLMSSKVIGPNYAEAKPSVMIKGTFSANITLPTSNATSGGSSTTTTGRTSASGLSIAGVGEKSAAQNGKAISPNKFALYVVGTISLDYAVISTSGLQGKLSYMWAFNGKPVGTGTSIDVDVPITAEMVKGFEYNKANVLGVVSITVTDSFGRSASASETITIGNPEDLRAFAPAVPGQRGYIDPIEQAGQQQHGDPACIVGWQKEGGSVSQNMGALKSYSTFSVDGKDYAIVGTQKV